MKLTTPAAAICVVGLCSASPILPVIVDNMPAVRNQNYIDPVTGIDYSPLVPDLISALAKRDDNFGEVLQNVTQSIPHFANAEVAPDLIARGIDPQTGIDYSPVMPALLHALLQRDTDLDAVVTDVLDATEGRPNPFQSPNPNPLQARNRKVGLNCALSAVIQKRCQIAHVCRMFCMQQTKNFPYFSCKAYLINNRCPEGMTGLGFVRPPQGAPEDIVVGPPDKV